MKYQSFLFAAGFVRVAHNVQGFKQLGKWPTSSWDMLLNKGTTDDNKIYSRLELRRPGTKVGICTEAEEIILQAQIV